MVVIQPVANSALLLQSTQYAKLVNCFLFLFLFFITTLVLHL